MRWLSSILIVSLFLLTGLVACTENFGVVPLAGTRVSVRSQRPIGPVLQRAAVALGLSGPDLLLGTDRAIYRIRLGGASPEWLPEHPGFVTDNGEASPQFVQAITASPDGRLVLHNTAVGPGQLDQLLFASSDGGRRYRAVGRPELSARSVDDIAVVGKSAISAAGYFVAQQRLKIYELPADSEAWVEIALPEAPISIDALSPQADGELLIGVTTLSGNEVWSRSKLDGVVSSVANAAVGRVVAIQRDADGGLAVAGTDGVQDAAGAVLALPGASELIAARLESSAVGVRYALLTSDGLGQRVHIGMVGEALETGLAPPATAADFGLELRGGTVYLCAPNGDVLVLSDGQWTTYEFAGLDPWWSALSEDASVPGNVFLGNRNTGRVHRGDPGAEFEDLGARLINSTARFIYSHELLPDSVWLGSFGLYRNPLTAGAWTQQTSGMRTYLLSGGLELMEMSTMSVDPADPQHLWAGTTEGNGPYESINGGVFWMRRHDGLGIPATLVDEDGLPNMTQVRRILIDGDATLMATFRGGLFRLDSELSWAQSNTGLPDINGAAVDSCCFALLEREVDLRDLVVADDDAYVAATGWGIYRDDGRDGSWEPSLDGLTNFDIFSLAVHPTRLNLIAATARGGAQADDWLFLSSDYGRSWRPVDTDLVAVFGQDVVWSDAARNELVVIVDGRGAWALEIDPR